MFETYVTVVGNVVADPVERTTRSGGPFTTFRIASTPRYRTADGKYADGTTSFYGVCAFNVLAANAAKSVQKGQPVIVHGKLRVNEWRDDNGQPRTSVEIDASHIGHDLTWGRAIFSRMSRAESLGHEPLADPEVQASLRERDEERPANVDEHGVMHEPQATDGTIAPAEASGPVAVRPGETRAPVLVGSAGSQQAGSEAAGSESAADDEDNPFGDPERDEYELVRTAV